MNGLLYRMFKYCSLDTGQKVIALYNQVSNGVDFYLDYDKYKGLIPNLRQADGFSYMRGTFHKKYFLTNPNEIQAVISKTIN